MLGWFTLAGAGTVTKRTVVEVIWPRLEGHHKPPHACQATSSFMVVSDCQALFPEPSHLVKPW